MSLYAISDLHLSFFKNKPMDIFGNNWRNHAEKIKNNWDNIIKKDDIILIPGDVSWAKNLQEFKPDINYLHNLNGKKVILSGNHDYWWSSTNKLNDLYEDIVFIKNSFFSYKDFAICGTRGWLCPHDTYFTNHDEKIYKREVNRLILSLESAKEKGYNKFIVMLHFPPTNDKKENSKFVDVINKYNVKKVIYGHLHGENSFYTSLLGIIDSKEYILVSSDYLNFIPKKIMS